MDQNSSREWYETLKTDDLDDVKLDFAVAVARALDGAGKKRIDLAKDLNVSAARITKVLRGDSNLTMEMMHKIAQALDHKVHIHLAPSHANVRWIQSFTTQNNQPQLRPRFTAPGATQVLNHIQYAEAA